MTPPKDASEVKVGDIVLDKDNNEHVVSKVRDFGNKIGITTDDNGREKQYGVSDKIEVKSLVIMRNIKKGM